MEVCVSGPVWSSLLLELANSKGDSEGFLTGDVSGQTVNSISDSSSQQLKYQRISTIHGIIPCFKTFSFYDNVGRIDEQQLDKAVCHHKNNIIGWYRFRRNSHQIVAMRERHVHHNLLKELRFTPSKEFLLIVFTASIETGLSVHSLNYSIYSSMSIKSSFNNHELKVINLGDTSHSEYKLKPDTVRTPSRVFREVADAYREDFIDKDGCLHQPLATHSMHLSLVTRMKDILSEVKNSESIVGSMAEQVDSLRERIEEIKSKQLEQKKLLEENEVVTAKLIEIKETDTKHTDSLFDRVVEGAEATHRVLRSKHHIKLSNNQTKSVHSESNHLIDLEDIETKRPFTRHTTNQLPDTLTSDKVDGCHGDDDDDDETQDFTFPENKAHKTVQDNSMMESMSPTF